VQILVPNQNAKIALNETGGIQGVCQALCNSTPKNL
jgi:hypothetical protein